MVNIIIGSFNIVCENIYTKTPEKVEITLENFGGCIIIKESKFRLFSISNPMKLTLNDNLFQNYNYQ